MPESGKDQKQTDQKQTGSAPTTDQGPTTDDAPKAKGRLGPAGESSDPAVHDALARLEIARSNRAALDVDKAGVKEADDEVAAAEKALADLGYQAP